MITLFDFVVSTKKHGIIDDATGKPREFGTVLGFCWLNNGVTGVLLNSKNYTINEAYIGEDKLVHYSEWSVSGIVGKEKMHLAKGVTEFNSTIPVKCRRIKTAMMLDGSPVTVN